MEKSAEWLCKYCRFRASNPEATYCPQCGRGRFSYPRQKEERPIRTEADYFLMTKEVLSDDFQSPNERGYE